MNIDRRTFIKGTTIGVASLATGVGSPLAFCRPALAADTVDQPLSASIVAYWHEQMVGFLEKYGDRYYTVPKEPGWKLHESGTLKWTTVTPYPNVYHRDVEHLDKNIALCAYGFAVVDTTLGKLRADHFFKDTFHTAKPIHVDSGNMVILSLNGRHLGYSGYTTKPKDRSLNFEGVPLGNKRLKVWAPGRSEFGKDDSRFHLWEKV